MVEILISHLTKMKEVRLKERLENAFAAFFDDEKLDDDSLSLTNYENNSQIEQNSSFSTTSKKIFKIFKQIFFFLPANFLLFFMSIAFTAFFLLRPVGRGGRGFFIALLIFLLTSLMTVFGLGSLREPKHYLIPLSTISIGVILGIVGSLIFGDYGFNYFLRSVVPYFIPLAYIAPILVKSWVDKPEEPQFL